jgi:hypothetical protein
MRLPGFDFDEVRKRHTEVPAFSFLGLSNDRRLLVDYPRYMCEVDLGAGLADCQDDSPYFSKHLFQVTFLKKTGSFETEENYTQCLHVGMLI